MADINVLVVADGNYLSNNPPKDGISFAPGQDLTDDTFTVSEFIYLLTTSQTPTISVDTAHRRQDRNTSTNPPTIYPKFENFNFATTTDLSQYDVIWLLGYEGWNGDYYGSALAANEIAAINQFMDGGGGVFATGDHNGMGSYLCGQIPRVRTMRKWFGQASDIPPGFPTSSIDYSGATVTSVNRPGGSTPSATNPPYPGFPSDPSQNRADTVQKNPTDTANAFQFEDQSDNIPQVVSFPNAIVHPILQGPGGTISRFPDHMHEGEVVTPAQPIDATEYPAVGGYQPLPGIIATGAIVPNHSTNVDQPTCTQVNFVTDPTYTAGDTVGTLCAYDGRGASKGRVVTDSSFHHYLDLNLNGDPCGSTPDRMAGFGPAQTPPTAGSVLADLQAFYVNTVTWLARQNPNFYFVVGKSTFGSDESSTGTSFPAFWLVVEGFTLGQVQAAVSSAPPQFAGPLAALNVISAPGTLVAEGGPNSQRILIPYNVQFSASSMGAFPPSGQPAKQMLLEARLSLSAGGGTSNYAAETTIELTAGADPYFQNVNATENNAFYLSQDLCVFTMTPGESSTISGVPSASFPNTNPVMRDTNAANTFIQQVLSGMNGDTTFTNPGNTDPFANFPSSIAATGDSSVTPTTLSGSTKYVNYNFAIARVRLMGTPGATTNPKTVRVFFRLFLTQSNDTDFQPTTTYLSVLDPTTNLPRQPLPAPDGSTQPFFATGSANGDYVTANVNNFSLTVGPSGDTSAYFGCHLDVYDQNNNSKYPGTHHCLVAQIAYDDTPIVNSNGITLGPEDSDKLAQRNLQITPSGNPGGPAAHRIPQTFDTRPSAPTVDPASTLPGYPDELMIEWGNIPVGSTATIYWPQVNAVDVVRLAMRLHSTDQLTAVDEHTVQCTVNSALTYVPIPFGTGPRFAGLFTVDLPLGVRAGERYNLVVRRISTRRVQDSVIQARRLPAVAVKEKTTRDWRYVVGTFQVMIPVSTEDKLLWAEENTLAIMKWRLAQMPTTNRWYPVMLRYISYLAGRVDGFGGNAGSVLPSPTGVPAPAGGGHPGPGPIGFGTEEFTGKVEGVVYDRFGDFEGFCLLTETGHKREFHATEAEIAQLVRFAWIERVVISVVVRKDHPEHPVSIILRRAPWRPGEH